MNELEEHNKNTVELIGHYGNDEIHSLSAWTSTRREIDTERHKRMGKLLEMLANEGHETPFEKSFLHFIVTTDIASHIHLIKHRIGVSVNAESARYKELKDDKFYIPSDWDEENVVRYEEFVKQAQLLYHQTYKDLMNKGFSKKRAKESSRFYLPYGTQITSDVGFNFRSFVHFQRLRNNEHAQKEIREIAQKMLHLVKETGDFVLTLKAFKL